jgi:hypothetical protein
MEWGYDSDRGRRALRRMNQLHGQFAIANEDFVYVPSTFIFEPIRWNARFGWRLMCDQERLGSFYFWCEVGRRMNIKDIPNVYDDFERYNVDYERRRFCFTQANHRVGAATREMFLSWLPRPVRPLARPAIHALIDDPILTAFGFPRPSLPTRYLVAGALKLRAIVSGWLPARRRPRLRTEMKHPTYPNGYVIEELGPPGDVSPRKQTRCG